MLSPDFAPKPGLPVIGAGKIEHPRPTTPAASALALRARAPSNRRNRFRA
jgi:hypothetical protein